MTPDTGQIDQLDVALIEALREDPRVGLLEIARRVGVARGTVQARLAKLEQRGVVTGYGPEIEPAKMGYPIAAFVFVELNQGRLAEAAEAARAVPEVLEVDAVSGDQDLICRVVARDTEHLQEIVNGLVALAQRGEARQKIQSSRRMIRMITTIPGITIVAPSGSVANAAVIRLAYPMRIRRPIDLGQPFELRLRLLADG
jgi:DNA-binding Lrp family transcriptional regulator